MTEAELLAKYGHPAAPAGQSNIDRISGSLATDPSASVPTPGQDYFGIDPSTDPLTTKPVQRLGSVILDYLPEFMSTFYGTGAGLGVTAATGNPGLGYAASVAASGAGGAQGKFLQGKILGKPASGEEVIASAATNAGGQAIGEALPFAGQAGRAAFGKAEKVAKRLVQASGGKLIPKAAEYRQVIREVATQFETELLAMGHDPYTIEQLKQVGMTAADLSDQGFIDSVDAFANGSAFSAPQRRALDKARQDALELWSAHLVKSVGNQATPDDLVRMMGRSLKTAKGETLYGPSSMEEVVARMLDPEEVPQMELGPAGPQQVVKGGGTTGVKTGRKTVEIPQMERGVAGPMAPQGIGTAPTTETRTFPKGGKVKFGTPQNERIVPLTGSGLGLVDVSDIKRDAVGYSRAGLGGFLKEFNELPEQASFREIKRFRSRIGQAIDNASGDDIETVHFRQAAQELYGRLTEALDTTTKAVDTWGRKKYGGRWRSLTELHQYGNQTYKEGMQYVNKRVVNDIIQFAADREDAGLTGMELLRKYTGRGHEADIDYLVKNLDPENLTKLRRMVSEGIFANSYTSNGLNGAKYLSNLGGMVNPDLGLNVEARHLRSLFGKDYDRMLHQARVITATQRRNSVGGKMAANIGDIGVILGLVNAPIGAALGAIGVPYAGQAAGVGGAGAAGYVLTMRGLAKVMNSKWMSDALVQLLTTPAPTAAKTFGRKTAFAKPAVALTAKILGALEPGRDYQQTGQTPDPAVFPQ